MWARFLALTLVFSLVSPALHACERLVIGGARLTVLEVVPPVDPPVEISGQNSASIVAHDKAAFAEISVSVDETITEIHLHGPAWEGANGPVMRNLPLPVEGIVNFAFSITPQECYTIESWASYVDIHTVEHPNGLLRGQLEGEILVRSSLWTQVKTLYR